MPLVQIELQIRPATRDDAMAILRLQKAAFARFVEYQELQTETVSSVYQDLEQLSVFVGEVEGILVGVIRARVEKGVCLLFRLAVHPDFQRRGYGWQLMKAMERLHGHCHCFHLDVIEFNEEAIALYQKLGYHQVESRTDAFGRRVVGMEKMK